MLVLCQLGGSAAQPESEQLTTSPPLHNVQIVQYLLLSTEQAGTYLQSSFVWHHLTYINPSLFDRKQNIENSIFVSFKL